MDSALDALQAVNASSQIPLGPQIFSPLAEWLKFTLAGSGLLLGFLLCFFGSKVVKFCFFAFGFFLGGVVAGIITWKLTLNNQTTLIAAFAAATVLGAGALCIAKLGKFLAGFSLAFFPAYLFIQTGSAKALGSNVVSWSVLGACVLLIALLLYAVKRHVVVIATAYTGGLALMLGVSVFLPNRAGSRVDVIRLLNDPTSVEKCYEWQCYALAGGWLFFGTLGMITQLLMHRIFSDDDKGPVYSDVDLEAAESTSAEESPARGRKQRKQRRASSRSTSSSRSYDELVRENRRLQRLVKMQSRSRRKLMKV